MIFPQSLLLVSALTLIGSSLSAVTHRPPPSFLPVDNGPAASAKIPKRAVGFLSGASTDANDHQRGAGDPCGPGTNNGNDYQSTQTDFESTLNTCGEINTTFTHAPSIYGVQCLNANPSWKQSINLTSCTSNIDDLCDTIALGRAPESQWSWSSGVCLYIFSSIFLRHPGSLPPKRHETKG